MNDWDNNNVVGKISLKEVDVAIAANETTINVPVTFVSACLRRLLESWDEVARSSSSTSQRLFR